MNRKNKLISLISAVIMMALAGCTTVTEDLTPADKPYVTVTEIPGSSEHASDEEIIVNTEFSLSDVPEYSGIPYTEVHNNIPYYDGIKFTTTSFELYSELDSLGRCQTVFSNIGQDLMPTEPRGDIGSVKPTGWHTVKYDIVNGKYLYNRCHLIGFQLTAENANELNLITGTRALNVDGMLLFENMVADYIHETGNHVLYRVTPIFEGDNLVASGVLMEGRSVEDDGEGICFCVYCYNVQPGIEIDYKTGDSRLLPEDTSSDTNTQTQEITYVLNTSSKKFHYPGCSSAQSISEENLGSYAGNRQYLIDIGYTPCGRCNP